MIFFFTNTNFLAFTWDAWGIRTHVQHIVFLFLLFLRHWKNRLHCYLAGWLDFDLYLCMGCA